MDLRHIQKKENEEIRNIQIGNLKINKNDLTVIAGPCSVESEKQIFDAAEAVKKFGGDILRGGAYKPRTSPYSFQGLGEEGLRLLKEAGRNYGLPVISEVMDTRDVETVYKYVDLIQIGSRNMQNFSLLREVGKTDKPIMLKRGMAATIKDWLNAAEYIANEGNMNIVLCERGIRTFENYTRNTLDLTAVPIVKKLSSLPVFVDPSHGTGRKDLVLPMSKAAVAAGADGVMVEIHPNPCEAYSDAQQSLNFQEFSILMRQIKNLYATIKQMNGFD